MGRKKPVAIDDDEYSMPQDEDVQQPEPPPEKESRGKKNKKGSGGGKVNDGGGADDVTEMEKPTVADVAEDEDEAVPIVFTGKKKSSKSKKSSKAASLFSAFNAMGGEEDADGDDVEAVTVPEPIAKLKPESKQKPKPEVIESNGDGEEGDEIKDADVEFGRQSAVEEVLSKKHQQKKKKKKGGRTAQEEEDLDRILAELGEGLPLPEPSTSTPVLPIAAASAGSIQSLTEQLNSMPISRTEEGDETIDVDLESSGKGGGEEAVSRKQQQKKKKKKSGRSAQEEEDLEMILAELGEGAPPSQPSTSSASTAVAEDSIQMSAEQVDTTVDDNVEEKDGEAEVAESAAAKKKKKKKEKEKEKKAAAAVTAVRETTEEKKDEGKGKSLDKKVTDKKVPKNVRQMQEALARRKEEEEKKKREDEERLRKEEEERLRKEEEERLAEEAKRRKKEREKEKLLKKKQDGKLLTGRQKEEARRLEAMRNQFLARGGEIPVIEPDGEVKKRPKYQTKKAKPAPAKNVGKDEVMESQLEVVETEIEQPEEDVMVEEEAQPQVQEVEDRIELKEELEESGVMEEDEDEDEWDAKSWDDIDVTLPATSAFAEEEEDVVNKLVVKKVTEHVKAPTQVEPQLNDRVSAKPAVKKVVAPHATLNNQNVVNQENGQKGDSAVDMKKRKEAANKSQALASDDSSQTNDNLRSPICCILGHVDTGKTKLLDCIRGTNVQEGEAGGITQQIGATYFPAENIRERTKELKSDAKLKVPGLLVIDTPGHESFNNLRSRGSSLCDIAILVVDIMHGLEPQTIESLNLLKSRQAEFIVALNKVDRLYGWKKCPNAPFRVAFKQQSKDVLNEFQMRLDQIITEFKEQGLNTELYYKNKDMKEAFNIVPTSAISGEGIPDLLLVLVSWTQKTMVEKLTFVNELQCTVLEVKVVEGLGTTIDVVLVNGVLHEGDQIVVCGMQGPIVTNIRALLTPHPMKELRIKGSYLHHKEIKAAQGVKLTAQGLENAIAGTALYVVGPEDDLEAVTEAAMQDMNNVMSRIDKSGEGVCVQASTLGSLEALLEFLKSPAVNIPVSGISIGPVHKKDVMKASVMLERKKEYATILAFDVKVTPDARDLAEEVGVKIFNADIIYHLFDQFKAYIDTLKEEKKKESAEDAVFPCILKIMPNCIFNKKDPIVLGVDVLEGIAKIGTPICIPSQDFIDIGRIASIEINHKQVDVAKKGQKVAIKIIGSSPEEQQKMYGRHFEIEDELVSHISRKAIDILKSDYRDELSNEEWLLVLKLKKLFKIP
uniref:Eukaryotic translation initiation factor 5B n=1 Tax=Anthurium amnicola TaxID=1678845 RepID=A0A1D1XVZ2_9ARAE